MNKQDFPICQHQDLIYLDSAATTQKPQVVIDAISHYYQHQNANVHRGIYRLSQVATDAYESVREKVAKLINADASRRVVFTKGTTEAINLVASSYGGVMLQPGDEVIVSTMEHHSNIVPWQRICAEKNATLKVIDITEDGEIDLEHYRSLFNKNTKLVSIIHASNVLGTINPIQHMVDIAHSHAVPVLVDGAQAVGHFPVDISALDCDFYVFSGHKIYGPTGVGVLVAKSDLLDAMQPYQSGGDMILTVSFEESTYNTVPAKFEAGTPNMAGVVGMGAAIDYLQGIGYEAIIEHEQDLLAYATEQFKCLDGCHILGAPQHKTGVISFYHDDVHPHDIATLLDEDYIAVRAGHHCAMPLIEHYGLPATVRASFGVHNDRSDVDALIASMKKVNQLFGVK